MTATITAVQADPTAVSQTPASMTEGTLQDFVTSLQNGAISGMPQLANPGVLASELFSNLRGYFDRAQHLETAIKNQKSAGAHGGDGVQLALLSVPDELQAPGLHGGPARNKLEPADTDSDALPATGPSFADIQHLADLLLESSALSNEEYFLAQEVSEVARSVNSLVKGQ